MSLNHEVEKKKKKKKRNKPSSSSSWAWKFNFELKLKFIKFNLKATNILHSSYSSKISPFPINFALTITKADTHNSKSIKSKFLWFFRKLGFHRAKGGSANTTEILDFACRKPRFSADRSKIVAFEEPNYVVSIVIGFIGLLSQSISQKDQKRLIFYSSVILLVFFAVIIIISLLRGNPYTDHSIFHFCNWEFFKLY